MHLLPELFVRNREWAARQTLRQPDFFARLCALQAPHFLWVGCADSRVPANEIVGLAPGELFVHRNIANLVPEDDANCLAVIQYAVDVLRISHVIVCGHYHCGGVQAALGAPQEEPLEHWLSQLRALRVEHADELARLADDDARWDRMCELNVVAQVRSLGRLPTVRRAWQRGQALALHGWIYDLKDGLLHDLDVSVQGPGPAG